MKHGTRSKYHFPGRTVSIGSGAAKRTYQGDATLSWSQDNMVRHPEKYVILDSPIRDVTAFTLDYQLVFRDGVEIKDCTGPRTIYINDGISGWVEVGSFSYNEIETVHVDISLASSSTIAAVAVTANCARPDAIISRIALLDIYSQ